MATHKLPIPLPLFDSVQHMSWDTEFNNVNIPEVSSYCANDFKHARGFLYCYKDNMQTFNAYRREIERYLSWCWLIADKSLLEIRRDAIEDYIRFCQAPPITWIGLKKVPHFIVDIEGVRMPNPEWRPFVATVSKAAYCKGQLPDKSSYAMSQKALQEIFAVISSFYNYLIQENITEVNPVLQIKQKSKFLRKQQSKHKIRRLSDKQWQYVIETAELMAAQNPEKHERTLFIITALYAMYLRINHN
jgi:hypothetical protein